MNKRVSNSQIGYAACVVEITSATNEVQLFPAGVFRARDGRPQGISGWVMNETAALRIIAQSTQRATPYILDYEHQTLNAADNGQPAPRAATFTKLQWRPGQGLFATDVTWTARAKSFIDGGEYGYISPVFPYDKQTGEVLGLLHAALTNDPAIDGMAAVAAARYSLNHPEDNTVNEALLKLLGLKKDASEAEISQAVAALKTKADSVAALRTALGVDENGDAVAAIAALKSALTGAPDPAKFVPIDVVKDMQTQLAALTTQVNTKEVDELVADALKVGKLLPAQESWAKELGKKDVAALKSFISTAQPIAALNGSQTGGKGAEGNEGGLNDEELAVCKSLGLSVEEYKKGKAE